jgi:hypothetical protein
LNKAWSLILVLIYPESLDTLGQEGCATSILSFNNLYPSTAKIFYTPDILGVLVTKVELGQAYDPAGPH